MAVFDVEEYLASLKTKYNIPDEELRATEVKGGFLRQDKFSRQMQETADKQREYEQKFNELAPFEKYLQTLETNWGPREQWSSQQVNFARQNEDAANRQPASLDQATVQQLVDAALEKQNRQFSQIIENTQRGAALLIDFIPEARDEWRENYAGKYGFAAKFPKSEFEQFISPGDPANGVQPGAGFGVPLQAAWNMFKTPYDQKRIESTYEEKIKAAAEDGFRRGASQGPSSLEPYDDITTSASVIADRQAALPKDQQRAERSDVEKRSSFTTAYESAIRSGGMGTTPTPAISAPYAPVVLTPSVTK